MDLRLLPSHNQDTSGECQKRICPIHWVHDDRIYPHERWSDFCIIIFGWWTGRLVEIMEGAEKVDLFFMDGPYRISVNKISASDVELTLPQGEHFGTCRVLDLVHELLRELGTMINVLKEEGGSEKCVQSLTRGQTMLKSALAE